MTALDDARTRTPGTAAAAATAGRWRRRDVAAFVGIGLLLGLLRSESPSEPDALWSIRAGVDVLSTGRLPHVDPYSWSAHGHLWIPNSWLWNVVIGEAYRVAAMPGVWLVVIALTGVLGALVAAICARRGARPLPSAAAFLVLGMLVLLVAPRAQTVSNLIAFALPPLMGPILLRPGRRWVVPLAGLAALQCLWMNLHSAALVGPVVVGGAGFGLLISRRPLARREILRLAVAVAVTAVMCLATPYGAAAVTHSLDVRSASAGLITEWDHIGVGTFQQVVALVVVLLGVLAVHIAWRDRRFDSVAVLLIFMVATASAVRFMPMLALFMLPEFAMGLGRLQVRPKMYRRAVLGAIAVVAAFAAAHVPGFAKLTTVETGSPALVAKLPYGCRLLNDYQLGDLVILERPDVRVSMDGRNDVYGRDGILRIVAMLNDQPGTSQALRAAHVTCVLAPTGDRIVAALSADPSWRVVGRDAVRTLLTRVSAGS